MLVNSLIRRSMCLLIAGILIPSALLVYVYTHSRTSPGVEIIQNDVSETGQDAKPQSDLIPVNVELGNVLGGQSYKCKATLHNSTDNVLQVTSVTKTCSCIVTNIPNPRIQPHQSCTIDVEYKSPNSRIADQRTILVRAFSGSDRIVFDVKLRAKVIPPLDITDSQIWLSESRHEHILKITNNTREQWNGIVCSPKCDFITTRIESAPPEKVVDSSEWMESQAWKLYITVSKGARERTGRRYGSLAIQDREGKYSREVQIEYDNIDNGYVIPSELFLGKVCPGQKVTREISIRQSDAQSHNKINIVCKKNTITIDSFKVTSSNANTLRFQIVFLIPNSSNVGTIDDNISVVSASDAVLASVPFSAFIEAGK